MKTSTANLSKNEGSWAEDERIRERRSEQRIRDSPFADELGEMFSSSADGHFSRLEGDFRPPFLFPPRGNGQTVRFDRGEINSFAHTPKMKGVPCGDGVVRNCTVDEETRRYL